MTCRDSGLGVDWPGSPAVFVHGRAGAEMRSKAGVGAPALETLEVLIVAFDPSCSSGARGETAIAEDAAVAQEDAAEKGAGVGVGAADYSTVGAESAVKGDVAGRADR